MYDLSDPSNLSDLSYVWNAVLGTEIALQAAVTQ